MISCHFVVFMHSHVHLYWKLCGYGYANGSGCAVYVDICTLADIPSVDEAGICQSDDTGRLRICGTSDYMPVFARGYSGESTI